MRISCPIRESEFRISGFDPLTSSEDICDAIASFGKCPVDHIKVGNIKRDGLRVAWVRSPVTTIAEELARMGFINIGWTNARIDFFRLKRKQCYRCWHYGHVRESCRVTVE